MIYLAKGEAHFQSLYLDFFFLLFFIEVKKLKTVQGFLKLVGDNFKVASEFHREGQDVYHGCVKRYEQRSEESLGSKCNPFYKIEALTRSETSVKESGQNL